MRRTCRCNNPSTHDESESVGSVEVGKTSCRSTESKRPHRFCHLANNVENVGLTRDIPCILQWAGRLLPELSLLLCIGPPSCTWFVRRTRTPPRTDILIGYGILVQFTVATNRQTHRQAYRERDRDTMITMHAKRY